MYGVTLHWITEYRMMIMVSMFYGFLLFRIIQEEILRKLYNCDQIICAPISVSPTELSINGIFPPEHVISSSFVESLKAVLGLHSITNHKLVWVV